MDKEEQERYCALHTARLLPKSAYLKVAGASGPPLEMACPNFNLSRCEHPAHHEDQSKTGSGNEGPAGYNPPNSRNTLGHYCALW